MFGVICMVCCQLQLEDVCVSISIKSRQAEREVEVWKASKTRSEERRVG